MRLSLAGLGASVALWATISCAIHSVNRIDVFKRARKLMDAKILVGTTESVGDVQENELEKRTPLFLTEKSKPFAVNGSGLPDVNFDVGESYAGLLPISNSTNETRELFFWFFPSSNPAAKDEITAWFNGGPGCSSLSGLLTENGPFLWQAGTYGPTPNPYSWVNLTNMVWIEQPVGVGYTQGVPNITDEIELSAELMGFWKQFVETFNIHNYKVYLTGESYAGQYIPYIADSFISANDTTYFNLKGVAINDPVYGDSNIQQQVVVLPFVEYWANLFDLNQTFLANMRSRADFCNYTWFLTEYFTFPPPAGPFSDVLDVMPEQYWDTCDLWSNIAVGLLQVNPCLNIYHVSEMCPILYSEVGPINVGDYVPPGSMPYFNRSDVKRAINAPIDANWVQCTDTENLNVFGGSSNNQSAYDISLPPTINGVLQRVIEHTNNTIIGSGDLDMLLPTNGTLMVLQNMTWHGKQGFQKYPGRELYVPYHFEYNLGAMAGAGWLGSWGSERGLTFYRVRLSGHELPGYVPGAAYRVLELLLGRIQSLDEVSDFTTQRGNYQGK